MNAILLTSAVLGLVLQAAAHGQVDFASSGGQTSVAPNIYYDGAPENAQTAIRKMYRSDGKAFVLPSDYYDASAMSCESASGAPQTLPVNAGDSVQIHWVGATGELLGKDGTGGSTENPWVHGNGFVANYIAPCNGDCSSFDSSGASWVKLSEWGYDPSSSPSDGLRSALAAKPEPLQGSGVWGLSQLIQQGSNWYVDIPSALANGQYLVRNELVAMHSPGAPQHYISCTQINVNNGGGTTLPQGTNAASLYNHGDMFVNFDIYSGNINSFRMPGPAIWDGASSGNSNNGNSGNNNNSGDSGSSEPAPAETPAEPAPAPEPTTTEAAAPAETSAPSGGQQCRRRKRSLGPLNGKRSHLRNTVRRRLDTNSF